MIFLGQASNYSAGQALRHLFAHGNKRDAESLRQRLAEKYQSTQESVRLYHTGRSALAAGIQAVVPLERPVIIPGLTCIAVVRAVRAAGCEPVFVDIDQKTLQYDWSKLEEVLRKLFPEESTDIIDKNDDVCYNGSIVAQNTLGLPLEMTKLESLAKKYHLAIIEDLAHSAGRFYPDGREAGTVGAVTVISFGKGKAIDTIEGGAVIVRDTDAEMPAEPSRRPKWQDRWRDRWYPVLGMMIRAGYHIGLGKIFTGGCLKLGWIARSGDAELDVDVELMPWQAKLALKQLANLSKGPLREHYFVSKRAQLLDDLRKQGYYLDEIWYDTPVGPARCMQEANFPSEDCPTTVKVAQEIINLPTWYPEAKLQPVRKLIEEWQHE